MLRLSFRNLWRNQRRTLLTMSAMAAATAILIVTMGLTSGAMDDSVQSATGLYHGHAKITTPGYLDGRDIALNLAQESLPREISQDPHVLGAAGRVRGFALLSAGDENDAQTQPVELLGVSPSEEERVSALSRRVVSGSVLPGDGGKGILLGTALAKRLEAEVGGEVVAMGQAADGSIAAEIFTVSGLIDSGDVMLNGSLALVDRDILQRMTALEGRVHEWVLKLDNPLQAREWAAGMQASMPGAEITPWQRLLPTIAQMLDASGANKAITALIFYFAVVLVTVNTMYMAQLERMREFAVMGAIGLKPRRLMSLIVLEGTLMSGIASVVGGLAGTALSFYLVDHPVVMAQSSEAISFSGATMSTALRTLPTWDTLVLPVLLMMLLGGLISFFPAWKLGRLRPVDALREV
jgi:ABC-type lipoprotein release transport system permease subunit